MSGTVCVIGSVNVDRFVGLARLPQLGETILGAQLGLYPGGKGLNQAVAASRCGAQVRMCAAIGPDDEGRILSEVLESEGINTDFVQHVSEQTGMAYVLSMADGENSIIVAPGANTKISKDDAEAAVRGARVVLAQLEVDPAVVIAGLKRAKAVGAVTILNAAPVHNCVWEILPHLDILIVNETEAQALGGVESLKEQVTVIETLGAEGARVHVRGEVPQYVAAFEIEAVDTTGAGDAFCGGFAAALARGDSITQAVLDGAAAGAIVAQHRGAQTEHLTTQAVHQLSSPTEVPVGASSPRK